MQVSDPTKARSALALLGVVLFVEGGFTLLSIVVVQVLARFGSGAFESWFTAQSFLWLAASIAFTFAVWRLTRALKETELRYVLLGLAGLALCPRIYWIGQIFADATNRGLGDVLGVTSVVVNVALLVGCCVVVGKLGRTTGFAAAIGAFLLFKAMISVATVLRSSDERLPMWVNFVSTVVSVGCTLALGALALHARRALATATATATAPQQAPVAELQGASAMRLMVTGVALLVLGVGGTALSYAAAESGSGGGRYVIATGAIATGLVQLVRGLTRLGR